MILQDAGAPVPASDKAIKPTPNNRRNTAMAIYHYEVLKTVGGYTVGRRDEDGNWCFLTGVWGGRFVWNEGNRLRSFSLCTATRHLKALKDAQEDAVRQEVRTMANINNVTPFYTGGGIYCFVGQLDGYYFIASDGMYDIRLVDADPIEAWDEFEFEDWQDAHLVRDLGEEEALETFLDILHWIKDNKPDTEFCNYLMSDIDNIENEVIDLMKGGTV